MPQVAARTEHEADLAGARASVEEVARLTEQVERLKAAAAEQRARDGRIDEEDLAQARAAQDEARAAREAAAAAETARAQAEGVSAGLRERP